ncbi:MAG: Asp23/Gls24 family envelope stress response protein [Oscillospiraceae bacterium]
MVKIATSLGTVTLSTEYFANLVGSIASGCYGVKGMATSGPVQGLKTLIFGQNFPEKGVRVYEREKKLEIELHIMVVYGVNIAAIVDSIANKVRYTVECATGLKVCSVNVFVDEMVSE